mgnify:CR=1 FL=1
MSRPPARPAPARRGALARFLRSEDGSVTIEFALLFPVFFGFFLSTFELGMVMTRQVMLDRGVDMAVREVRTNAIVAPPGSDDRVRALALHALVKAAVCDRAAMIPDCLNQLRLELVRVDPRDYATLSADVDCVDRTQPMQDPRDFTATDPNLLYVMRACSLFDPYLPFTGLGARIPRESGGAYALVSTTAFVVEPL